MRLPPRVLATAGGLLSTGLLVAGLGSVPTAASAQTPADPAAEMRTAADSALAARVDAAIRAASDVPADSVRVIAVEGTVDVTGSVMCDGCGGTRTPGGTGTVQQSLGAVVRAVPGVEQVRFFLRYRPR